MKSLDVLIGLTVIMLVLSMGVTMLTQFVTTVLNSRGRHLKRGLVDLLDQIDPALPRKIGAARTRPQRMRRWDEINLLGVLVTMTSSATRVRRQVRRRRAPARRREEGDTTARR